MYPLETLGADRFQRVVQSLLASEFKGVQCFPLNQADGGRDATVPSVSSGKSFVVYQVKFAESLKDGRAAVVSWFRNQIDDEIEKVSRLASRGATRYVLVTNAIASASLDRGTIDLLQAELDRLPVEASAWWRDDVERRLDLTPQLKWTYPELMRGLDFLPALLAAGLGEQEKARAAAVRAFVADQARRDAEVRFKQIEMQNDLLELCIDLPISLQGGTDSPSNRDLQAGLLSFESEIQREANLLETQGDAAGAVSFSLGRGGLGQRESTIAAFLLHQRSVESAPRVVIEGAPGQGKSTITQYICQVLRLRLLGDDRVERVPDLHKLSGVKLPIRAELRDFAAWLQKERGAEGKQGPRTLEAFLAGMIEAGSGGASFSVGDLQAVVRRSSVMLVLDGLDEIADRKTRQVVVDEVQSAVQRLDANALALQVVVTSRPAAFASSPGFPRATYPSLTLGNLSLTLIEEYARRWTSARRMPQEEADDLVALLREKLQAPHVQMLAQNPMQLAILLSLINARGASLPDKRTALYDEYVSLFLNRESEKSEIVRAHRDLLVSFHRFLAWRIQLQVENGRTSGRISHSQLSDLLSRYLRDEGHESTIAETLFDGILERVVAIVSRVEGTYEFEVQPLREYFAGRHLYETAPYSPPGSERAGTKMERFEALSRAPYWLNVVRFYAGCYSKGELSSLIDSLRELHEDKAYKNLGHVRALESMLLSDWVFAQHPKSVMKVSALLLSGVGVDLILASDRYSGALGSLVLSEGGGRAELVETLSSLIKQSTPLDRLSAAIRCLYGNLSEEEALTWWSERASSYSSSESEFWLFVALGLGLRGQIGAPKVDEIVGSGPISRGVACRTVALLGSERAKERDRIVKVTIDAVLDGVEVHVFDTAPVEPAAVLSELLSAHSYRADIRLGATRLRTVWLNDDFRGQLANPTILDDGAIPEIQDLVRIVAPLAEESVETWLTMNEPWRRLLEGVGTLYPQRYAAHRLIVNAVVAGNWARERSSAKGLFDDTVSLLDRVVAARARSGNVHWWTRACREARSEEDSTLLAICASSFVGPTVLRRIQKELGLVVRTISESSRWQLYRDMLFWSFVRGTSRTSPVSALSASDLIRIESDSLCALLACRSRPEVKVEVYRSRFGNYRGEERHIWQFVQDASAAALLNPQSDVHADLRQLERSYAHASSSWPVSRMFGGWEPQLQLPREVADAVMERAGRVPLAVVRAAEASIATATWAGSGRVGPIAKSQRWH